jgi:dihydrofolate reductase
MMTDNIESRADGSGSVPLISFMVAAAENGVIGKDNRLPWQLPNDLKYFKSITWGMPVIMGRKSYDAVGKPLAGRTNIVITRNQSWQPEGVRVAHSLDEAIEQAEKLYVKEIFIIGGAEIFKMALARAGKIYRTLIHHHFEGDAFFPPIDPAEWTLTSEHLCAADDKNRWPHTFQIWNRK